MLSCCLRSQHVADRHLPPSSQQRREKKKKKDEKERRKGPKREPRAKKHFRGIWKANADGTELPHGLGVWNYDGTHTFYPPKLKNSKYEGTFRAGMRHGPGSCKYKDNGVFEGTFRKEDRHGHGVHIFQFQIYLT